MGVWVIFPVSPTEMQGERKKKRNLNNEILAVHDSSRSCFIYGRDAAGFQGRRLRLQSAEREPLPTIVASASPTCYKRSLRRNKVVHTG